MFVVVFNIGGMVFSKKLLDVLFVLLCDVVMDIGCVVVKVLIDCICVEDVKVLECLKVCMIVVELSVDDLKVWKDIFVKVCEWFVKGIFDVKLMSDVE